MADKASLDIIVTAGGLAGSVDLYIADKDISISVSKDDSSNMVAYNLMAALNANADLPVRASVAPGTSATLTLMCNWYGASGNDIYCTASVTNGCATLLDGSDSLTGGLFALTDGTNDPDITDALTIVAPGNYTVYVPGYNDLTNLQALRDHLDNISGPIEQRPAVATVAFVGDVGDSIALAGGLNASRITLANLVGSLTPSWCISASYGAMMAYFTDPSLPFDNDALPGVIAPPDAIGLLGTEVESLLHNGVTPLVAGNDGITKIVRAISTYTLAPEGYEDANLLDITTIRSLDYLRLVLRTAFLANFSKAKITDATLTAIHDCFLGRLLVAQDSDIVENVLENAALLLVERSTAAGRVNCKIPAAIIQGLHVLAAEIDLII